MSLYIEESQVFVQDYGTDNEKRFRGGDSEPYQSCFDTTGKLFKACLREHGRCLSKVYVDRDGKPMQVGWSFFKRATDKDHYDVETWITVYVQPPVKKVTWEGAEYPTFARPTTGIPKGHVPIE